MQSYIPDEKSASVPACFLSETNEHISTKFVKECLLLNTLWKFNLDSINLYVDQNVLRWLSQRRLTIQNSSHYYDMWLLLDPFFYILVFNGIKRK
jgi:hypothetical protein